MFLGKIGKMISSLQNRGKINMEGKSILATLLEIANLIRGVVDCLGSTQESVAALKVEVDKLKERVEKLEYSPPIIIPKKTGSK
jgi:hypothetical protein